MKNQGRLFLLCAACFYLVAAVQFLRGSMGGIVWLGLGTAWFCVGMAFRKRK